MKKIFTIFGLVTMIMVGADSAFAQSVSLSYGDKGTNVYKLQTFLKRTGFFPLTPTGNYFGMTEESMKNFQEAYGLTVTGKYDNETDIIVKYLFGDIFTQAIDMTSSPKAGTDSFDDLPLFDARLENNS